MPSGGDMPILDEMFQDNNWGTEGLDVYKNIPKILPSIMPEMSWE